MICGLEHDIMPRNLEYKNVFDFSFASEDTIIAVMNYIREPKISKRYRLLKSIFGIYAKWDSEDIEVDLEQKSHYLLVGFAKELEESIDSSSNKSSFFNLDSYETYIVEPYYYVKSDFIASCMDIFRALEIVDDNESIDEEVLSDFICECFACFGKEFENKREMLVAFFDAVFYNLMKYGIIENFDFTNKFFFNQNYVTICNMDELQCEKGSENYFRKVYVRVGSLTASSKYDLYMYCDGHRRLFLPLPAFMNYTNDFAWDLKMKIKCSDNLAYEGKRIKSVLELFGYSVSISNVFSSSLEKRRRQKILFELVRNEIMSGDDICKQITLWKYSVSKMDISDDEKRFLQKEYSEDIDFVEDCKWKKIMDKNI